LRNNGFFVADYGGHNAYNYDYGGHPAPSGRALPNLINAVKMFKINVKTALILANAEIKEVDFDFKHTDRIYKVG